MKEIDFLPASFHEARRRRFRTRRYVRLSLALTVSFAALHFATGSKLRSVEATLNSLQAGEGNLIALQARLANLEGRRQVLLREAALVSQLGDDAPLDAVIGELTRLMTDSMALRSLNLESAASAGAAEKGDPVFTRGGSEAVLLAVAANDIEVGIFYGRLAGCPLFDNVRLSFSREVEQNGRRMREFELKLTVRRVALPES